MNPAAPVMMVDIVLKDAYCRRSRIPLTLLTDRHAPVPRFLPAVLGAAILGLSVSGPLARLSSADALAIATWRVSIALAVIGPILAATGGWREYRTLQRRDVAIAVGAGTMLALHFWSWIASLEHTTVAASVVLVNLHPLVIVTGSALWLGERPSGRQLGGLGAAMVGAAIVAYGDSRASSATASNPLFGDLLAFIGALTVGLYYLAGRSLRQRLSLWAYVGLVYSACLVALLILALATDATLWPQPAREWWIFGAIAVGPMLIGHTGFNYALRYVPAYVVSLAILVEPVGATLIAAITPGIREVPGIWTLVGGAVVLAGLALGVLQEGRWKGEGGRGKELK